jgi:hypothetical protein
MKETLEYMLSFIEEIAFMGVLVLLYCFFKYDLVFSTVINESLQTQTLRGWFYLYLFISPFAYLIILIVAAFGEKYWGFYNKEFCKTPILFIFMRNIFDDIAFPFFLLATIFKMIFRIKTNDNKVETLIFFAFWVVVIVFIIRGIIVAF